MTFLVDNQLPPALARWIAAQPGAASFHVSDLNMTAAIDMDIWRFAARREWILISKDADFANLHAKRSPAEPIHPKAIELRSSSLFTEYRIQFSFLG